MIVINKIFFGYFGRYFKNRKIKVFFGILFDLWVVFIDFVSNWIGWRCNLESFVEIKMELIKWWMG